MTHVVDVLLMLVLDPVLLSFHVDLMVGCAYVLYVFLFIIQNWILALHLFSENHVHHHHLQLLTMQLLK